MSQPTAANIHSSSSMMINQGARPKLLYFTGDETEDFRYFRDTLESYFAITGVHQNPRKIAILASQLKRSARDHYDTAIQEKLINPEIDSYDKVMNHLQTYYITNELLQRYELAFNDMCQGSHESPRVFLSRIKEAAKLASISDIKIIENRFRMGLTPEIKKFCVLQSALNFDDWLRHADGYWNAYSPRQIALVENPFVPRENTYEDFDSQRYPLQYQQDGVQGTKPRVTFLEEPTYVHANPFSKLTSQSRSSTNSIGSNQSSGHPEQAHLRKRTIGNNNSSKNNVSTLRQVLDPIDHLSDQFRALTLNFPQHSNTENALGNLPVRN